jgi:hypothetical protein
MMFGMASLAVLARNPTRSTWAALYAALGIGAASP